MPSVPRDNRNPLVILDTNVFVSSLLFSGRLNQFVDLWESKKIICAITKEILDEYVSVLAYPKFQLTENDIHYLIEEFLLYAKTFIHKNIKVSSLSDSSDEKFLQAAKVSESHYLISGDKVLLAEGKIGKAVIMKPSDFLAQF
jgi:uncharacterized protein